MQVVCESDYQDIYRIKDGVLLVVNKFKPIHSSPNRICTCYSEKTKAYNKDCQKHLKVLQEDYVSWSGISVPKDTVIYHRTPVEIETDKSKYEYQIKTTGEMFSGNSEWMLDYIGDIINVIKSNA